MKKTFIFGFIFCFFFAALSFNASAQEYKNFDLSKYYTPDIVRNQLDLNTSFSNSLSSNISENDSSVRQASNWNLMPVFNRYKNTRKQQTAFNLELKSNGTSNGSINLSNTNSVSYLNANNDITLNYSSLFYNKKKLFLSLRLHGDYFGYIYKRHYTNNTNKTSESDNTFNLIPQVGIGLGRIEQVTDARQAIYILDELNKKRLLKKDLSQDEIFKFAQGISKVKNKRFFDARLRKIEEITTVDSLLSEYIYSQNAAYFTTLNDMWEYGAINERKSGQRFEMSLSSPIYYHNQSNTNYTIDYLEKVLGSTFGGALSLTYIFEKPVAINWQHSVYANLDIHKKIGNSVSTKHTGSNSTTDADIYGSTINATYELRYYPNTRTSYSLITSESSTVDNQNLSDKYFDNSSIGFRNTISNSNLYTGISANHYFSPQLKLSAYAGMSLSSYRNSLKISTESNASARLGFSVTYSLF